MAKNYLRQKIDLVGSLVRSPSAAVDYNDICVLVSAILSSCCAFRWPGKGIDRVRFIEMLAVHSDKSYKTTFVSEHSLLDAGLITRSQMGLPDYIDVKIYTDNNIDLDIDIAAGKYPMLDQKTLRKYTYASIIYDHIRCGYLHTYGPGGNLGTVPASQRPAMVDYISRSGKDGVVKVINFRQQYLIDLATHHVDILPDSSSAPLSKWWANG